MSCNGTFHLLQVMSLIPYSSSVVLAKSILVLDILHLNMTQSFGLIQGQFQGVDQDLCEQKLITTSIHVVMTIIVETVITMTTVLMMMVIMMAVRNL